MPAPVSGFSYRFRSNTLTGKRSSAPNKNIPYYLNCYGSTSGSTVNGYLRDGTTDQIWNFDGTRLIHEKSEFALSRSSTTSSAVKIGSATSGTSLSGITFELISGNNYRIVIGADSSTPRYLTATPRTSETSTSIVLSWETKNSSDSGKTQSWEVEKLIKVTNFPSGVYPNNTEFFHPSAGWIPGTYALNGGASKLAKLKELYRKCYGLSDTASVTESQCMKNLYGALTYGSGTWQDGTFHLGYDFNRGEGTKIFAPYDGVVKNTPDNNGYGEVTIYANSKYYTLMHMIINTGTNGPEENTSIFSTPNANKNNHLGTEYKKGVAQVHLHIEAATTNSTALRSPILSSNNSLPTIKLI